MNHLATNIVDFPERRHLLDDRQFATERKAAAIAAVHRADLEAKALKAEIAELDRQIAGRRDSLAMQGLHRAQMCAIADRYSLFLASLDSLAIASDGRPAISFSIEPVPPLAEIGFDHQPRPQGGKRPRLAPRARTSGRRVKRLAKPRGANQ